MTDESAVSNGGTASTYAVVKTGGKQYRVKVGDRIAVERLAGEAGNDITFDQVLLVGGGGETLIGDPLVDGAQAGGHRQVAVGRAPLMGARRVV